MFFHRENQEKSVILISTATWATRAILSYKTNNICGTLRNLVPCTQFKKREKQPSRSVTFKVTLLHGCLSRFLNSTNSTKLRKASQHTEIILGITKDYFTPCINPFVPNAPFLYPLQTSENLTVFCFQGVEKGYIGNEWVK